ncbi:DUF2235 domain-containing protein [Devosia nitrariae]|uniref:Peptidoglycan-binding protein LysM n=1 Tax=Devosia nitrariae TaxID=2071872 RepID=A0ABQ5W7Z6_9HYPH|nr:DUF2235 domain-containing protein [Devosia nitrariae]GLQ56097.1 peptidoglycan-binding protein LysM [Devosia nitrariae]
MKRIAIFCDGTWNRISKSPTNVVLGAQLLLPVADDEVQQLTYYRQGVGTSWLINQKLETYLAGAFGLGLFDNIADAYRFLVFNYETGDEIYIFGFSRGAFTARSLAGLIRKCGIVNRDRIGEIEGAFELYRRRGDASHPDRDDAQRFRAENSPETIMKDEDREWRRANGYENLYEDLPNFTITYLGVWDTVGALGIPKHLIVEQIARTASKYEFHNLQLSSIIASARHAVALDETRLSYAPSTWENLADLQKERPGAYAELWFPGNHGSVGGGGDIRGLSDAALLWVMEGAAKAGLGLDTAAMDNIARNVDFKAPLSNVLAGPGFLDLIMRRASRTGPEDESLLSQTALARLRHADDAGGWKKYRPPAIGKLLDRLFPDK